MLNMKVTLNSENNLSRKAIKIVKYYCSYFGYFTQTFLNLCKFLARSARFNLVDTFSVNNEPS